MTFSGRLAGATLCAAALLATSACGGEESAGGDAATETTSAAPTYDAQEQREADATANLTDFFNVYTPVEKADYFSRGESECMAEAVVEDPGIKGLQRMGILNDELQYYTDADPRFTPATADAMSRAVIGCSDLGDRLREQATSGLEGASPSERACAAEAITDDLVQRMLSLALRDQPLDPLIGELKQAFEPCKEV